MAIQFLIVISISLVMGIVFFFTDLYEKKHPTLHVSLIAGISLSYFFLVILPEISENIPEYPFNLTILEYLFVVLGFVFVHVSEKMILQKVEANSQKRMRKLLLKERTLEDVEKNIEKVLTREIYNEELDKFALKEILTTLNDLNKQEEGFKSEINQYKIKIQTHISEDLRRLRFFTNFTYHFLIGVIIVGLLTDVLIADPVIPTIFFFFFAWFRALISHRTEAPQIFSDLDIYEIAIVKNSKQKFILPSSTLLGVVFGLILEIIFPIELELIYVLYSFISGVIMYTIFREVIPQKEKGKPSYFLIGFSGFTTLIVIINIFTNIL